MSLIPFFDPKGVLVAGASRDPHKLGYGVVRNLKDYMYKGPVYPVNRSASEILGYVCYNSVKEVPDPVDLAIIVVPADYVCEMLQACGERGIQNAVIVSGGFSETGEEGKELESNIRSIIEKYNMRVIGPNCVGTIDTHTPVNSTFVVGMPEAGSISFSSQSGAMVAAVIDWARGAGVGFSRIVSLGNQLDVNETEMIELMRQDPNTKVITGYMEGVSNGRKFMEVAARASAEKPFIVLKGGRGKSGAKAVSSHTGALAGSAEAYEAAFRKSGVISAQTMEEMFDRARALNWQPLPKGKRIGVLTNAGGPAILAVDALEEAGLEVAELTDKTKEFLSHRLPSAASTDNPVDVLAGSGPGTYGVALDAMLSDEQVDAVVVIQAPQDWFLPESLAEVTGEVSRVHHKPVVACLMGKASIEDALKVLHKRKVPNVSFPERVASIFQAMIERREWLESPAEKTDIVRCNDKNAADNALKNHDWPALLEQYGIKPPPQCTAQSEEEVVNEAEKIGYPVVLKMVSEKFSHKTDIKGVKLNLKDADEVKAAFREISDIRKQYNIPDEGVLLQKMLSQGTEVIVGTTIDVQFGPLILFGTGGTDVELIKDIQTELAPLSRSEAIKMTEKTRAGKRLKGWRGSPAGDKEEVIQCLMAVSQLVQDYPDIKELEINPLYVMPEGEGAYVVDVRGNKKSD